MRFLHKMLGCFRLALSPRWVNDFIGFVGLSLVAVGCWWMYPPLAPIIVGVVFLALAIWGARNK